MCAYVCLRVSNSLQRFNPIGNMLSVIDFNLPSACSLV